MEPTLRYKHVLLLGLSARQGAESGSRLPSKRLPQSGATVCASMRRPCAARPAAVAQPLVKALCETKRPAPLERLNRSTDRLCGLGAWRVGDPPFCDLSFFDHSATWSLVQWASGSSDRDSLCALSPLPLGSPLVSPVSLLGPGGPDLPPGRPSQESQTTKADSRLPVLGIQAESRETKSTGRDRVCENHGSRADECGTAKAPQEFGDASVDASEDASEDAQTAPEAVRPFVRAPGPGRPSKRSRPVSHRQAKTTATKRIKVLCSEELGEAASELPKPSVRGIAPESRTSETGMPKRAKRVKKRRDKNAWPPGVPRSARSIYASGRPRYRGRFLPQYDPVAALPDSRALSMASVASVASEDRTALFPHNAEPDR